MDAAGLGPGRGEAYVRLLLTRGVGEITYDPAACPEPSLVIIAKPLPVTPESTYEKGVRVVMVEHVVRNHPDSVSPLIKSNNLINNALGMQQAIRANAAEAVFRNYRGELAECAQSNLFIVKDGVVKTPPLDAGLLAGITRAFVLEIGRALGIAMEEVTLFDRDLFEADEAFFTSTTKEIVPIVEVGSRGRQSRRRIRCSRSDDDEAVGRVQAPGAGALGVGLHRRAHAHQVAVAVWIVDATDGGPHLAGLAPTAAGRPPSRASRDASRRRP